MDDTQIIPANQVLPLKLHVLPLQGNPIFPGIFTPLMVASAADVQVVEQALSEHGFIGLVLTESPEMENPSAEQLRKVGTAAKIVRKVNLPDGGLNLFISTLKRFRIKKVIASENPITVAAEYLEDDNFENDEVRALTRSLIGEMKKISENNPLFSEQMRLNMVNIDHPGKIADFITSILNIDRAEQQKILETLDVHERMMKVMVFIRREQELMQLQQKIMQQINEKISKSQREYFLKEQLKSIKSELGMAVDAKSSEYQRFKEAIEKLAAGPGGARAGGAGAGEVLPDGAQLRRVHRHPQLPGDHRHPAVGRPARAGGRPGARPGASWTRTTTGWRT